MNSFEMMFGKPEITDTHKGILPQFISKTPQGTFKAIVKGKYLGTHKKMEVALDVIKQYLKS
tara:strand:- start:1119 stop:1304 length:186 start_codon:yes stop_codon:yes gene_type:complete